MKRDANRNISVCVNIFFARAPGSRKPETEMGNFPSAAWPQNHSLCNYCMQFSTIALHQWTPCVCPVGKCNFPLAVCNIFGSHSQSELALIIYLWLLSAIDNLISRNYCYLLCVCRSSRPQGTPVDQLLLHFLCPGTGILLTVEFMYNDWTTMWVFICDLLTDEAFQLRIALRD